MDIFDELENKMDKINDVYAAMLAQSYSRGYTDGMKERRRHAIPMSIEPTHVWIAILLAVCVWGVLLWME